MTAPSPTRSDRAIAGLLFVGSIAYLFAWPHILGNSDESHFLYHAKSVLEGRLPYRDFFEFYTPLANYMVALLFGVFGVQIATAKIAMAVLHAGIVASLFHGARALPVRTPLAIVGALTYLALGPPTWPYASPHWIATLMLLWILLLLLPRPLARAQLVVLGVLCGVLISTQHQTGVPILAAIAIVIALEGWLGRRLGEPPGDSISVKLLLFAAPAVAIPAAILLAHVAVAGFEPMFEQLVLHPLGGYRLYNKSSWGKVQLMSAPLAAFTYPLFLKYLPVSLAPIASWRLVRGWRARDRFEFERVSTLSIFAIATALTVVNLPDFIHLAFILAIYLLFGVETMEWGLAKLPASVRVAPWIGGFAIALLVAIGVHLQRNYVMAWEKYHLPTETEFGIVDMATPQQVKMFETVHAALENEPERKLFCYPAYASLYLMADAYNPTMHEIIAPGYLTPEQYRETIDILEIERVGYIFSWREFEADPMSHYLSNKFRCVSGSNPCWLYRRID